MLRYILFHHQTTTCHAWPTASSCCVISSFITKPQLCHNLLYKISSCVISSFITKPQQTRGRFNQVTVALYPLSSPNHNTAIQHMMNAGLRYILFHHQTTTCYKGAGQVSCCVISSFITKPQRTWDWLSAGSVALYPLSSPNHNSRARLILVLLVALYPLSSPNHNTSQPALTSGCVALYPLSSPNHNSKGELRKLNVLRYILFHHQTTTDRARNR